jgi:hypothetical protein
MKTWGPSLTTITEIPAVEITTEHRVEIAIRIALMTRRKPGFISWAEKWLSGKDRTAYSAAYSAYSAESAARSARSVANKRAFNIGLHMLICSVIYNSKG